MKKRTTIRDVAAAAGVSYQTVSRVINDRPDVAHETREHVKRVIRELNYQPSAVARSLASHETRILGLITADFSDYFFTQVIVGAEAEARQSGYHIILGSTQRNVEDEPEYLRLLTEREVDGILFARPSTEESSHHVLSLLHDVPVVTTAYSVPGQPLMVVDVDNEDGGRQATECLIEAGHHDIAAITGPPGWRSVNARTAGYAGALRDAGIPADPAQTEPGDWSYESGYRAMLRLLQRGIAFTAVFCHNDRMAIGAMRTLREAGRRIPGDVSIVGYDDIPPAAYCYPPLTTVHQPMQEVGRVATQLLLRMINDPSIERVETLLAPWLIHRDTVCQPRA